MAEDSIYEVKRNRDHIDRLYKICSLARIGAASTGTIIRVDHLDSAQLALWEVVYKLASEAVEMAELAEKPSKAAAKEKAACG